MISIAFFGFCCSLPTVRRRNWITANWPRAIKHREDIVDSESSVSILIIKSVQAETSSNVLFAVELDQRGEGSLVPLHLLRFTLSAVS